MSASTRFPILIGVTGKRHLEPAESASVEKRLRQVFRRLDRRFPRVPKVLLTGAAYGADAIAAGLVAHGGPGGTGVFPDWSVVALLPFDQALFEKDFRATASADEAATATAAERLAALRQLLDHTTRVMVRVLPPLRASMNGAEGDVTQEQLDKDEPGADPAIRHHHYEQVGQCIADLSTILVAVMDGGEVANQHEADGGSARVIAYRRAGRPDERGRAVACRSTVLRNDWGPLVDPPANYVWLIEPRHEASIDGFPVVVLPPTSEAAGSDPYDAPAYPPRPAMRRFPPALRPGRGARRHLRESLVIPKAFEQLHRISARLSPNTPRARAVPWKHEGRQAPAPLDLSRGTDPRARIQQARVTFSLVQGSAKTVADRAFRAIAVLFVGAVFFLEVFSEFRWYDPLIMGCYLALLAVIFAIVFAARLRRWQPLSEDYRTVNEMLRIQRVWWSAGLADRVDHAHLQASDPEISRIRDAVRTIVGWTWLRSNWPTAAPPTVEWAHVRGLQARARPRSELVAGKAPADWVGGQIAYFAKNHDVLRRKVGALTATTWPLFAGSAWLAVLLWLWLTNDGWRDPFELLARKTHLSRLGDWGPVIGVLVWSALAFGWFTLWTWRARRRGGRASGESHARWRESLSAIAIGLVGALLCALAIQSGADVFHDHHEGAKLPERIKGLTVATFVTLSAIAGATRYVSDKLNFVAQAQDYREALGRFERAERLLADVMDASGEPADLPAAQRIVRDLAILALRENETWLKARRERPLSPVVG